MCFFSPWGNVKMHKLIEYQIENVMKFDLLVFVNINKCCASYSPGYLFDKI